MRPIALLVAISAARASLPARAAESSPFDRAVLAAALRDAAGRYDPAEAMLRGSASRVGYHTTLRSGPVHPTRESIYYAAALLDAGGEENRDRAVRILRRVISLQDRDPASRTYGIWSWYLEEPLAEMSPPDWNWADFLGTALAHIAIHRIGTIPEADRRAVLDSLGHAARSVRRRNVGPGYTNIAAMGTFVALAAGEILGDADLVAYGIERAKRFAAHVDALGTFSEYSSPTYACVTAMALARIRSDVRSPEARAAIEPVERLLWRQIGETFHLPTMQWAGPHGRSYSTDLAGNDMACLVIQKATGGRVRFYGDDALPGSLEVYRSPVACPARFLPLFGADRLPYRIRRTFSRSGDSPGQTATTYLGRGFALGSVDRFDLWNQRRAIIAYWGRPGALGSLRVRCLHDGYDFASGILGSVQEEGDLIAAVGFATDYGDTHVSLDRIRDGTIRAKELVVRIEIRGVGSAPDPWAIDAGSVRIASRIVRARFAGADCPVEVARRDGGFDVDVVLHRGDEKAIDFRAIDEACVALAVSIREGDAGRGADPFAGLDVRADGGRLRIGWPRATGALNLAFPTRPGPIQEIQAGTESSAGGSDLDAD
ncbi:MAG: hypothetical protein JXP34_25760 [Planctomycetes bacterium]|nr:hypothetical protein [Planctomycetota bacterium]